MSLLFEIVAGAGILGIGYYLARIAERLEGQPSTDSTTLPTRKNSPIDYLTSSKAASPTDGRAFVPGKLSTAQPDRSTNFTDSEIRPSSEIRTRSASVSEVPIAYRSNLSESLTTFTSRNSPTIRASHYAGFSSSDISRTVPHSSAANRATSWHSSERSPAIGSRISPIDKPRPLFRPPSRGLGTGRTSAHSPRLSSTWRESWRPSTRGRPSYAKNLTESWYASASHRKRSRDSTNWNRANLPRSFTSRR
jgi:hypothetical protein